MRSTIGRLRNSTPVPFVGASRVSQLFGSGRADAGAQMRAFGEVGTLFGVVSRTANATGQVDWKLFRKSTDMRRRYGPNEDSRTEVTQHLALKVWNNPNDFYTRQVLVESGQQHVDLTGEGWCVFGYDNSPWPTSIWPVRPDRIAPVPSPTQFISGYVYTGPSGETVPLEKREIMRLRMPNPLDPYRGMGPVQSLLADLDASRFSAEWNRNFFLNSAEPGGIIEVPKVLTDTEFDELRMRWDEQHRGLSKAHRVALLEHGKWVPNAYSQRDMQFAQLRTVSRDTILEAFGFPKSVLGITENVNKANAEAGEITFGRWLTKPRLERWKQALNSDFLPLFGETAAGLEFDYCNPIPTDTTTDNEQLTARANAVKALCDAGADFESACEAVGLPPMDAAQIITPPPVPPSPGEPAGGLAA